MKQHINKVTAGCYYQLRRLRQIRRRVWTEVTTQQVLALVTSRLDYCNSVLAALPQSTIEPLQCVQNTAARLIFNLGKCEHVSPCLIQLHWVPIRYRITYKLQVSALSGRHRAAYFLQSDAIRPALSLWDRQLPHTSVARQVQRAGLFLLWPSVMELPPCRTTHHLWH